MDKYSGMNKVESKVSQNKQIVNGKKASGGFWKTFAVQAVIALIIGGALFVSKMFDFGADTVIQKVKESVCFDAFGYVSGFIDGILH